MSANCSLEITKDKMVKVVSKLEYFMFRAMEQEGVSVFDLVGKNKKSVIENLLNSVRDKVLPQYIQSYAAKVASLEASGDTENAEEFKKIVTNLLEIQASWKSVQANFIKFSTVFELRNKLVTGEDGLVDLTQIGDDDKAIQRMVFDVSANEIDPLDDVDKSVEIFIRSLQDDEVFDEYGFTSSVNYSNFVRNLMTHVENSTSLDQIITKMEKYVNDIPQYSKIIDKLKHKKDHTKEETQFRINFRNSFAKAFMPIYQMSLEDNGLLKNFMAATGKTSGYQMKIEANFNRVGMPITLPDGTEVNLADNNNGAWEINKNAIERLEDIFKNIDGPSLKATQLSFLKGLGFEFSPQTEKHLMSSRALGPKGQGYTTAFQYIYNHFLAVVRNIQDDKFITNPLKAVTQDLYTRTQEKGKWVSKKISDGQNNLIKDLIALELKYNKSYNMDRNVITSEGNRMHALQLHNNFTVINNALNDFEKYPTLEDILKNEPSLAFLDPERNPSIRNSMFMNSLFFFDPSSKNYGKRRRIKKNVDTNILEWSATEGEYNRLEISNTGGLQLKKEGEDTDGASSTDLNDIDKLLQDINSFRMQGYNSVLRLGDKSTDLGVKMDYYFDKNLELPQKRPIVSFFKNSTAKIFSNEVFLSKVVDHLQDTMQMRYLAKKGFFKDLTRASVNSLNTWGLFEDIIKDSDIRDKLDAILSKAKSVDEVALVPNSELHNNVKNEITDYMNNYAQRFYERLKPAEKLWSNKRFKVFNFGKDELQMGKDPWTNVIHDYLANTFLMDIDQMKVFFGDSIYFKDFHKRSPKDSATGIFASLDKNLIEDFNNYSNSVGYGANTNLSGRNLIERLYKKGYLNKNEYTEALARQSVDFGFRSAVLKDVNFVSSYKDKIIANIEKLKKEKGLLSPEMIKLYDEKIKAVIENEYKGTEADGQGKCTFDFYRNISILTGQWSNEQEETYKKIVDFAHYDELADAEKDPKLRSELIKKRDAVGYDPLAEVYFPPKKFQYAGPMEYNRTVDNGSYTTLVPVFDKFSIQPLIPTLIKGTADEHLAKRMEFGGYGYVKFESGSKVETPKDMDDYYKSFDGNNPGERTITPFLSMERNEINGLTDKERKELIKSLDFKSANTLFFNHLKEQVTIDSEIHDTSVFGSQIRKLIMMNLEHPDFKGLYQDYKRYIDELVEIEKATLFNKLGIRFSQEEGKLKVDDLKKMVDYFLSEVKKKNQDSNVIKALNYDAATGKFTVPLDATVQAQVIEGIIISAINNNLVRYKANGTMLIQVATTGMERINYSKKLSDRALETFGNTELKYYDLKEVNGKQVVTPMQVKVGMTRNWLPLLQMKHKDGKKIESIHRMNEMLKDEEWMNKNRKSVQMVAYRIPTQGKNFQDVMEIAEFLPAQFGDAIVMPSEVVIKSGSDFDIDKMFILYPSLSYDGEVMDMPYKKSDLTDLSKYNNIKSVVQNRLINTMSEVILHPANYIELITPSTNYEIMPIVDEIYYKLYGTKRQKTDYKHSEILDREKNIKKFLSLLTGKNDLGIAALANTFNVLFQYSDAKLNPKQVNTLFSNKFIKKTVGGKIEEVSLSSIYDEDGNLKSEFFSEFINAFVDVAKDDYVFAVNVVTELSPLMFFMKYMGISSDKILNFVNQPIIRRYTKLISLYDNKFLDSAKDSKVSARRMALAELMKEMGVIKRDAVAKSVSRKTIRSVINDKINRLKGEYVLNTDELFSKEKLKETVMPDGTDLFTLSESMKLEQLIYLIEMLGLKDNTDSLTNIQTALKWDTNPYASGFDVFARGELYKKAIDLNEPSSVLTRETVKNIATNSIITPLNVAKEILLGLNTLFPVRNDIQLNNFLLKEGGYLMMGFAEDRKLKTNDDLLKFARTAKNDFVNYVLQNFIDRSEEGKQYFKENWQTDKSLDEYLLELIQSNKMVDDWNAIKKKDWYSSLEEQYPIVRNLFFERGEGNSRVITWRFLENSSNTIEKESVIAQLENLANLEQSDEDNIQVRKFFRDLVLYSIFQSGLNSNRYSYISAVPVGLINKLYGYAVDEFQKSVDERKDSEQKRLYKETVYRDFYSKFGSNNPTFFGKGSKQTLTREIATKGKWYSSIPLEWASKQEKGLLPTPVAQKSIASVADIPQNKVSGVMSFGSLVTANQKVIDALGPNPTSIDMIIHGFRTRTTRSNTEMDKYNVKVGDIVRHISTTSDYKVEKEVYARVTAIHPKGSPGWKGTWHKEGWRAEDVNVIDKFLPGAAAIEFEVIQNQSEKVVEGDIFQMQGIPVITTNLEGVHGAGLAQAAASKGLITRGDGEFKIKDNVIQLPVKGNEPSTRKPGKGAYSESVTGNNVELMKSGLRKIIVYARENKDKTILLPLAGLGHGEGSVKEILPILIKTISATDNIKLVLPSEDVSLGRQATVRTDATRSNMPAIKEALQKAGLMSSQQQDTVKENPLLQAGVKPTDMYGNAGKDIQMAQESTQFIGYKSGNASISSTDKYRQAWGSKANTGNYTASDVVMVSGSGLFRGVTEAQIKETLSSKYKSLLEKAIAAGASFRVGNQYAKGNLSDQLIASYLKLKGYTEERLDGYSRWSKSDVVKPATTTIKQQATVTVKAFRTSDTFSSKVNYAQRGGGTYYALDRPFQEIGSSGKVTTVEVSYEPATTLDATTEEGQSKFMLIKRAALENKVFSSIKESNDAVTKAMIANGYTALIGWIEESKKDAGRELVIYKQYESSDKSVTPTKLSTKENPLQVYSDGSDIKGTGKIGFGAVFKANGQVYDLSGTEESKEVQRLKELHPDAKFSNPTMEMMALVSVLTHFANVGGEHIVINQDYKGAVNYNGLWNYSEGSQQREPKPWKAKEAYIITLVNAAENLIKKIEASGGSVSIKWVKGHSGNMMNDLADAAAKSRNIFNNFGKATASADRATTTDVVGAFTKLMVDSTLSFSMSAEQIADLYKKEQLENESAEEFFNRMSCLGKIK